MPLMSVCAVVFFRDHKEKLALKALLACREVG